MQTQCSKVGYIDKKIAIKDVKYLHGIAIFRSKKQSLKGKCTKNLRPYKCPRCQFWHLTTMKKRKY